jgi:hypothetical protein
MAPKSDINSAVCTAIRPRIATGLYARIVDQQLIIITSHDL